MINTRHLGSLTAIAEHGSFAAAGSAIGRSHSAISLHIKALEEELGTRLVDRSVRPAVLTADGEAWRLRPGACSGCWTISAASDMARTSQASFPWVSCRL